MNQPLVSIIVPVFNREDLIKETLDSIISQDYTNWECIVIDDGSIDNSVDILKKYCKSDSRFRLFQRPEKRVKGANTCRNIGIEQSSGDYFQFLDSDDVLLPDKISLQLNALNSEDDSTIAICNWDRFRNDIQEAKFSNIYPYSKDFVSPKLYLNALGKKWIPPLCYLVSKRVIDKAGFWDEKLIINQDAEFFSRVIIHVSKIKYVHDAKVLYRHHTIGNVSGETAKKVQAKINSLKLIKTNTQQLYGAERNLYIEGSKNQYYKRIKNRFPELIRDNGKFFKRQIRDDYLLIRILKKITTKFERLFINK